MRILAGLSPGGSIALGIVVGVLSTSVQSLGLTLQRKSHILEDEKAPHLVRRPPHRRRRWQLGMAMFLVANLLGSSVQISTLPLPVLSTLQASGLVFNSICATLILGEPFTRWSLWGTLLVCSGAVLIAIFGAIPAPAHNLNELLELLARPPFVAWMALQAVIVITIAVSVELIGTALSWAPASLGGMGGMGSMSAAAAAAAAAAQASSRFRLARGLAYGAISGILSAHSLLVAKSAVELVVRTIADGNNQFRHWQAWALVLVFVALALTQLYYLHRGLKLVSTSVLYPLVFCVYNIIAILDGLIYFHQTDMISPLRGCLISLGTAILLSGVLALSWRLNDDQHTPPAGPSTLTPGLGLVEDSEGDAGEGEALLLGHSDIAVIDGDADDMDGDTDVATERQSLLPKKYMASYQTFALSNGDAVITIPDVMTPAGCAGEASEPQAPQSPTSPTSIRRHKASSSFSSYASPSSSGLLPGTTAPAARWTERAEIWGELEDQADSRCGSAAGSGQAANMKRHRSKTLPGFLGRPVLQASPQTPKRSGRRDVPGGTGHDIDVEALADSRRAARRRRKTMGFPGFHARRTSRMSVGGSGSGSGSGLGLSGHGGHDGDEDPQDALGGMWKLGWWKSSGKGKQSVTSPRLVSSSTRNGAADGARPKPHDDRVSPV